MSYQSLHLYKRLVQTASLFPRLRSELAAAALEQILWVQHVLCTEATAMAFTPNIGTTSGRKKIEETGVKFEASPA